MAIINVEYYSETLGMNRKFNVIYPESSKTGKEVNSDIPVLYLLHGMSGNEDSWLIRTGIDRLIRHTQLALVMPSTDLGFYTNTSYGMKYFDAIAKELPQVLHNFFPNLSTKREKNFIAGLSMGGYGAFKLALATNNFSYAASLSGALDLSDLKEQSAENQAYWTGLFGNLDQFNESENSILYLAEHHVGPQPKLYSWCGEQDYLVAGNDRASAVLEDNGFDLIYKKSPGTHEWYYWSKQIEEVLKWLPIEYKQEERLS
ncbi:MAG TPA: esterase family protein [Lactococcus sp.]|uniref:alpha/beta hydrolase n=1 Tax=Lactococcus TaxID=1357 RepID=UPI000E8880EE|nr:MULTISPECIES: alpha/beta hydrolase family protein [Lactococcus]HBC90167.1 esterase family protein [Lactococcus sp.]